MLAGRRIGKMAKYRRKKSHRSSKMTVPVAIMLPVAAVGYQAYKSMRAGDTRAPVRMFTGYDMATGDFNPSALIAGIGPIVLGGLVHKFAGPMVNKQLARAKVPYIRL